MSIEQQWEESAAAVKPIFEGMHKARETALKTSREIIQTASKCIKHIHRRQFEEAEKLLAKARELSTGARAASADHPEILYAGYIQDAEKEVVEAAAVLAIVRGEDLPTHEQLNVSPVSYLNGMGEAASECRRFVLDEMRSGSLAQAERILELMEAVYEELIGFDYPDGLTGGLRRTCDALRAVIERTRSDLTMTTVQRELIEELRRVQSSTD